MLTVGNCENNMIYALHQNYMNADEHGFADVADSKVAFGKHPGVIMEIVRILKHN
jgi:hypothetical protein